MSENGRHDPARGDGPVHRLVRHEPGLGLSLAERLAHHVHRFSWRSPLHSLRLRGRYPLKLVGVPVDPLPGKVSAGRALLEGRIEYRGELVSISELDFANLSVSNSLADHLHGFAWLRDLAAASPSREDAIPVAEKILKKWLAAHGKSVGQHAWRPDLCARRIFYWAAYAPMILSSSDQIYRSAVLTGLARQARHLDRTADKAQRGLRRIVAWCGVITAGMLIPGGEARVAGGEAGLSRAIEGGMGQDGGLYDRSPLHQLALVEAFAMLRAIYAMRGAEMPGFLCDAIERAVAALNGVMHGDGGLASWQGSGPLGALRIDEAISAAGVRSRPPQAPESWGYHRFDAGAARLIVDAAPPPMLLVRGACASTLAFEFSEGPHRLIVNCGGPAGGLGDFPPGLADALRATAAHSTLVIDDTNSTATYPDGTLGHGVSEVRFVRHQDATGRLIKASHDGYVRRFGLRHIRTLALSDDGCELRGEDRLVREGRRWRPQTHRAEIRFHLAPEVELSTTADGQGALMRIESGLWQFRVREGALVTEESLWVDESGWPRMTQQLVISCEVPPGGLGIEWILKRAD